MIKPVNHCYEGQVFILRRLQIFLTIFCVLLIVGTSAAPTISNCEEISDKVFRMHILANSDSREDQAVKLKVRDKVLEYSSSLYSGCKTLKQAIEESKKNIKKIESIVNEELKNNGYDYKSKAYVGEEFFDTRIYDDFTLPAGSYNCIKIVLGQGKGHNWWCVMFPSVCISGCVEDFDAVLNDDELKLIKEGNYVMKFKSVELYERIKSKIIS